MTNDTELQSVDRPLHSLDDWVMYPYEEDGQQFTVVQHRSRPKKHDLRQDGPSDSMNRDGRYLIPTNYFRDVVLVPSITGEMFQRQRKEILFRPGDIVVATFPRSGTTWTEQLVLLMLNKGDPSQLNTKDKNAYYASNPDRMGKIFLDALYHKSPHSNIAAPWGVTCGMDLALEAKDLDAIPFRRVFKTHHCAHMMVGMGAAEHQLENKEVPPFVVDGVKFLWVVRDPKDVALSMMRINTTNYERHDFPLTPFVKAFLGGKTNRGSWANHTREWTKCAAMHPESVLPLQYEVNRAQPLETARRIAQFLQIELTEEQLLNCVKYSSFSTMKKMAQGGEAQHMHKGQVGGWRQRMSTEMVSAFNHMLSDPALGRYGAEYTVPQ